MNYTLKNKLLLSISGLLILFILLGALIFITYENEKEDILKGKAEMQLNYRFRLTNDGPINLTSVSLRLAKLKTWDPVQQVIDFEILTEPNRTTSDEYENEFLWYEFEEFQSGRSIDLQFNVNLTLNLLDYSGIKFPNIPYDLNNKYYKLFMVYHPLTDTTDPGILSKANQLTTSTNPIDIAFEAYNFSSTSINYKLLATSRGASFALRNGYGDCDEYTTLFVALTRARGVPSIEHTAWLADFKEGFATTDEGAAAHAYPMFYVEGVGLLPADPTRGNSKLFENFLKTDEKRITMTRGPDQPYRLLKYRWFPIEGLSDPLVVSNYTITIEKMQINYFSVLRTIIIFTVIGIPVSFVGYMSVNSKKSARINNEKREKLLNPTKESELTKNPIPE